MSPPLLEVRELVRHYERPRKSLFGSKQIVEAVKGVSFTVQQGESFGIVGESGSGKSTLARAILALEKPNSGSVHFRGENLFTLPNHQKAAARRHIQMIFQDPFGSLDPKHKVRSVVSEPLALIDGVSSTEYDARVVEALTDVGLEAGDLNKYPHEFSGGQRQRIAIARALITRPDLIVADEPVSALDVSMQAQVLNLMMDLQKRFNLTFIIISHDLSVVRQVTDRLAVMKSGLIVEQGDTNEIFDRPQHDYTKMLLESEYDDFESEPDIDDVKGSVKDKMPDFQDVVATNTVQTKAQGSDKPKAEPAAEPSNLLAKSETSPTSDAFPVAKSDSTTPTIITSPERQHLGEPASVTVKAVPKTKEAVGNGPVLFQQSSTVLGQNLINGHWQNASEDRLLKVTNPSDGQAFGHIARSAANDIDQAVMAARRALDGPWGRLPAFERGRILSRLSKLVLENLDHLARLEARDVGKPLSQADADALALAHYFEFYAGAADKVQGTTVPYHEGCTVLTLREPHGVTAHLTPWNYPMQIIGRNIGAALAMGNACVLKPGEDASLTALEIGRLGLEAGLPSGVLNIVTGLGSEAGAALAAHPGIDHLSFAGSVDTGKYVQQAAGGHGAPVALELGGKSPQIVFADADLEQAVPFLCKAAIQNAGQTCSAGSHILVQDRIYDELTGRLTESFNQLEVGPAERDLDCGPVINPVQRQRIETQLEQARADGMPILGEGQIVPDVPKGGYYVRPTLVGDVPANHQFAQEEVFASVLGVTRFHDEEDAIQLANSSTHRLAAGIWTCDGARQMRLARALKKGQIFINSNGAGGGVMSSNFGREKGLEALYEFASLKTITMRHG